MYTPDQIRAAGIAGERSSIDVDHLIKILEESKGSDTPFTDEAVLISSTGETFIDISSGDRRPFA